MIGSEKRFELMDYVVNLLIIGSNKFFFFVLIPLGLNII